MTYELYAESIFDLVTFRTVKTAITKLIDSPPKKH